MSRSVVSRRALGIALASLVLFAPAFAAELAGVKMADTLTVGDKTLKLNGVGLRKKAFFKVYVAGLYVETTSKDANAILAADAPKAVHMHFLRSIGKDTLVGAFKEGFEGNAASKMAAQKVNIDKFLSFTQETKDGDVWQFTYVPGKGTTCTYGGKDAGTIEGKDFADALFSVWLGPKPPTEDLRKGMLGG